MLCSYRICTGKEASGRLHLLIMILVLFASFSSATYAGTSGLLGAYIAGIILTLQSEDDIQRILPDRIVRQKNAAPSGSETNIHPNLFHVVFEQYIYPLQIHFLSPVFFVSIGFGLPFSPLWRGMILWRGLVYATLMAISKFIAGWVWYLAVPEPKFMAEEMFEMNVSNASQDHGSPRAPGPPTPPKHSAAVLLGLALIARGEIALIVGTLCRPGMGEDLYLIVMWATLLCTLGGAVSVGLTLQAWSKADWAKDLSVVDESPTEVDRVAV